MGICLDTEQRNANDESGAFTTGRNSGNNSAWLGLQRATQTPPAAIFPMQNAVGVKFEPPKVPVIFVLGGPGSGKVTHCDNLMHERRGVVHINMTDLLQQYAIGNDMQDFGVLSSKTVTEVLMLEMKMSPSAKTYLVSGYPRSMRDVAEYSDKIQVVNGVVLVSWRQKVLERQIEYGAKLGHIVLGLAKMELKNFYKNVMPVADYFDQSNILVTVNGERNPEEVYKDFRAAVLRILTSLENMSATANGVTGVGPAGIPGEIVSVEPAASVRRSPAFVASPNEGLPQSPLYNNQVITVQPNYRIEPSKVPPVLWVIGGPGSNKAALCRRLVSENEGWTHFSLGQRLRALAESGGTTISGDSSAAASALSGGDMAPGPLVAKLLKAAIAQYTTRRDIAALIIDGFPRNIKQMEEFEKEYGQSPRMVLLDCSKLQLGRGRRDDSVSAFRRRLEVFREVTLPLLKALDTQQRLIIVDGDTDHPEVQREFGRLVKEEVEKLQLRGAQIATISQRMEAEAEGRVPNGNVMNGYVPNGVLPKGNSYMGARTNKVDPELYEGSLPNQTRLYDRPHIDSTAIDSYF